MMSNQPNLWFNNCIFTCVSVSIGEAEVVHGVEGEQMIEKLFTFILASQEGIPLIQAPVITTHTR